MALYHLPCSLWGTITEYAKFESVASNMAVISHSGERALSLMDNYYNKIKGNSVEKEKERQDLLQVVQETESRPPESNSCVEIICNFDDLISIFLYLVNLMNIVD